MKRVEGWKWRVGRQRASVPRWWLQVRGAVFPASLSPPRGEGLRVRGGYTHNPRLGNSRHHVPTPHPGPPHEPERRFVTGFARPNAPSRLETGAPPRFRGAKCEQSFVDSLPVEGRGRQSRAGSRFVPLNAPSVLPVCHRQRRGQTRVLWRALHVSGPVRLPASSKLAARSRGGRRKRAPDISGLHFPSFPDSQLSTFNSQPSPHVARHPS